MSGMNWAHHPLLQDARTLLKRSSSTVIVTGAGISKASGLATFREEGGHWRGQDPRLVASKEAWERDPRMVWEFYSERRLRAAEARPNIAHEALARWASNHPEARTWTQNVDGLHELAHHREDRFWRLHGTLWTNRCTRCGRERPERSSYGSDAGLPQSPCCGALERPGVVMFGDELPEEASLYYSAYAMTAQVVLIVGTSGLAHITSPIACAAAMDAAIIQVDPQPWPELVTHSLQGAAEEVLLHLLAE